MVWYPQDKLSEPVHLAIIPESRLEQGSHCAAVVTMTGRNCKSIRQILIFTSPATARFCAYCQHFALRYYAICRKKHQHQVCLGISVKMIICLEGLLILFVQNCTKRILIIAFLSQYIQYSTLERCWSLEVSESGRALVQFGPQITFLPPFLYF